MFATQAPRAAAAALIAAVLLAGCAQEIRQPTARVTAPPTIELERVSAAYLLDSGETGSGFDAADRQALEAFLIDAGRGRPDTLHVTIAGRPSPAVLDGVETVLTRLGVLPRKTRRAETLPDGLPSEGVAVVADRYIAHAPACERQTVSVGALLPGGEQVALGCSVTGNLLATVADPYDLLGNDAVVLRDGARAAAPVAVYRASAAP